MEQKAKKYELILKQIEGLIKNEKDWLANCANSAALLFHSMEDINWAGFYLYKEGQLVLGPFQGNLACIRIAMGKGVCGTSAQERKTVIVKDVHEFEGHIACDAASNSEIVVPIIKGDQLIGVLDIDSPLTNRFDEVDGKYLEEFVEILNQYCKWTVKE